MVALRLHGLLLTFTVIKSVFPEFRKYFADLDQNEGILMDESCVKLRMNSTVCFSRNNILNKTLIS